MLLLHLTFSQACSFLFFVLWKHYDRKNVTAKDTQQEIEKSFDKILLHQYMQFSGEKKQKFLNLLDFLLPTGLGLYTSWDSPCFLNIMFFKHHGFLLFKKLSHGIFAYFPIVLTGI